MSSINIDKLRFSDIGIKNFYGSRNFKNLRKQDIIPMISRRGERPYSRMFYIKSGLACFIQNNQIALKAPGGSIVYIPADCEFVLDFSMSEDIIDTYIYGFTITDVSGNEILLAPNICLAFSDITEYEKELFIKGVSEYEMFSGGHKLRSMCCFMEFLGNRTTDLNDPAGLGVHKEIKEAVSFIEKNYTENIDINDIIKITHLSPSTFRRKFFIYTGCSPVKYVNRLRLKKAQMLLKNEGLSVAEAASAVNIPDFAYFSKQYKSFFGSNPSATKGTH